MRIDTYFASNKKMLQISKIMALNFMLRNYSNPNIGPTLKRGTILKKVFVCFFLAVVATPHMNMSHLPPSFKVFGSSTSNKTWIYLCGLRNEFLPEYMDELKVLDTIGKQLNIKFLAMIPKSRCPQLNNRLCWPHDTEQELLQTYQEIILTTRNQPIQGYIGFSNGGFFLNKLAQFVEIYKPIISIGAAGPLFNKQGPINAIYLLIGKKDHWHYEHAVSLYDQSKNTNLIIHLIEYNEGHQVPTNSLKKLIEGFLENNKN